jgi:beta-galactosidase
VSTYVPWNFHETREGQYRFDGQRDFERFVTLAGIEGLLVVLRPGPYICAEWAAGGLPHWLLAENSALRVRTTDAEFVDRVRSWFKVLMPRVVPLLFHHGGPVIAMQVENEYGNFGTGDAMYMQTMRALFAENNIDCLLTTADGAHVDR